MTLGDYKLPVEICQFVKDVHTGFQILNLKNDSLRRRSDSIKYSVSGFFGESVTSGASLTASTL